MGLLHELYWAAGFLEGEGAFSATRNAVVVIAVQVQREPLDRLQRLFGGTIRRYKGSETGFKGPNRQPVYHWNVYGVGARGLVMTLYAIMSPRRQGQILAQLDKWRNYARVHRKLPSHCPHGHAYTGDNLYTYPDGRHDCIACRNTSSRLYQQKKRSYLRELAGPVENKKPLRTVCFRGHDLTPENTHLDKRGGRSCRQCKAAQASGAYRKKREALGLWQGRPVKDALTHCPRGHDYADDNNVHRDKAGYRVCRACAREKARVRRAVLKG